MAGYDMRILDVVDRQDRSAAPPSTRTSLYLDEDHPIAERTTLP